MNDSYYYQKPQDTRPHFTGGHWNDDKNAGNSGLMATDLSTWQSAEEFLQIRADQKMGKLPDGWEEK